MPDVFQPFVPRLVSETAPVEPAAAAVDVQARATPCAPDVQPDEPASEATLVDVSAEPSPPFAAFVQAALEEQDRAAQIRAEAVRLACIATGRILRHAVAFDPAVIVRFVEDALATSHDRAAVASVHPAHAKALAERGVGCRSDERLQLGEVVVELPSGSIGARLDERAALLVRSTADA